MDQEKSQRTMRTCFVSGVKRRVKAHGTAIKTAPKENKKKVPITDLMPQSSLGSVDYWKITQNRSKGNKKVISPVEVEVTRL